MAGDADPLVLAASLSLAVQGLPGGARPGEARGGGASPRRVAGLVADVLDRVDLHADFDPRRHYSLTLSETEMSAAERAAANADSVDDIAL